LFLTGIVIVRIAGDDILEGVGVGLFDRGQGLVEGRADIVLDVLE